MKIYVTFGQTHTHSIAGETLDKDCVAVFDADDESHGRKLLFHHLMENFVCFIQKTTGIQIISSTFHVD